MKRWLLVCATSVVLTLLVASNAPPAMAQPPDDQLGESASFLQLFPALRTLPAPLWFVPGVRISYQSIGATQGGGTAAGGLVQYDVVAMDGVQALVVAHSYTDNGAGALVPLGDVPKIGLPAIGEFWISPAVLVQAEQVANQNLTVVRLNRNVNGQSVAVVRFQADLQGSRTVWEFDSTTGLLLFYSKGAGGSDVQLTFLSLRTLQMPWTPDRVPNWVRPGTIMDYSGTQTTTVPGSGTFPQPYALRSSVTAVAPTWSFMQVTDSINGIINSSIPVLTGIGQNFGGFWLPRSALQIQIGQNPIVTDVDQLTGVQTTIQRNQSGAIVLRQVAQAFEFILVYHPALGSLDAFSRTIVTPLSTQRTEIVRSGGDNLESLNGLSELFSEGSGNENPGVIDAAIFLPFLSN